MARDRILDRIRDLPVPQQPCPGCGYNIVVYHSTDWIARCAKCEEPLPLVARTEVAVG